MINIVGYAILYETKPEDLEERVEKFLSENWELYGNPFINFIDRNTTIFYQVMILKENDE